MNLAVKQLSNYPVLLLKNKLFWAFICSILLHLLFILIAPNLHFDRIIKSNTLEIELLKKKEPTPVKLTKPLNQKPLQPKPKVEHKTVAAPVVKSLPVKIAVNEEVAPPIVAPTEIMTATAKADIQPTPIVVPDPPKPLPQVDNNAARDAYGISLWGAIEKHKQYPRIAQMRGWQGEVILELVVDGNGKLKSKKIIKSSGYDILDKQALDMIEKSAPFPTPPEVLRDSTFSIKVPIPFKLENQ